MRIKYNKLFPYPILCEEIDDYKDNIFSVEVKPEKDINKILLKCSMKLNDKVLIEMIERDKVDIVYHIECAKNLYRNIYTSSKLLTEISIDDRDLNGTVDICVFIVASQDIDRYKNDNFNDDYGDESFSIQKGNIMGFYNVPRIHITKDTEELAKMSSIFSISKKNEKDATMEFELTETKIKIYLNQEDYNQYRLIANSGKRELQPVINSMIIMPALIYAFNMIEKSDDLEYEYNRWFIALDKILKNSNIVLNKKSICDYGSLKLAQKLLNMPISEALKNLIKMED